MHTERGEAGRTCLHCVLTRVLRAEWAALDARGLAVTVAHGEAAWVPASGALVYRRLRRLLRLAGAEARRSPLRLTIVDMPGKAEVGVSAVALIGRSARVFRTGFPRHVPGTLEAGFAEGWVA